MSFWQEDEYLMPDQLLARDEFLCTLADHRAFPMPNKAYIEHMIVTLDRFFFFGAINAGLLDFNLVENISSIQDRAAGQFTMARTDTFFWGIGRQLPNGTCGTLANHIELACHGSLAAGKYTSDPRIKFNPDLIVLLIIHELVHAYIHTFACCDLARPHCRSHNKRQCHNHRTEILGQTGGCHGAVWYTLYAAIAHTINSWDSSFNKLNLEPGVTLLNTAAFWNDQDNRARGLPP